jgi:hypothetical protein
MEILTRNSLANMGCSNPDCTDDHSVLVFKQNCHPHEGLEARYEKATGLLTISCCVCETPLAAVPVAYGH